MHPYLRGVLAKDFNSFIAKVFATLNPGSVFHPNWHIELMAEYLEAARLGQINRLVINVPPRSLKSVCVSVAWPAWLLGRNPATRVMAASYGAHLSLKHSLDCRHVMSAPWYREVFADVALMRDQNEKHKFMTTAHGFRYATSIGGAATGEGGDVLIIDDPLNPAQAASVTARKQANEWFDQTFSTRLNDKNKGVIVLVMQRLHADDLSGHLLARGGWEHLCIPAIAPRECVYDFGRFHQIRAQGDMLHPAREGKKALARVQADLGSAAFAAQYQQEPMPASGMMVRPEWLQRYADYPRDGRVVQSWDTAIKAGSQHDASACATFVEHEHRHYLVDVLAVRAEYPQLKKHVLQQAEKWRPDAVLIEDAASGQSLLQDLRDGSEFPLIPVRPKQDKITRFASISAYIESGRVLLPENATWLAEFEAELLGFPAAAHDDRVDAFSQYLNWVRGRQAGAMKIRRL